MIKNNSWTTGLSKNEKKELEYAINNSSVVFNRLRHILDQRLEASIADQHSQLKYETPNWPLLQADYIGYQRAIKDLLTFFKED